MLDGLHELKAIPVEFTISSESYEAADDARESGVDRSIGH